MAKIDTDPNKGTRAEGRVATGHLDRRAAVKSILNMLGDNTLIVAGLAGTKGAVLAAVGDDPRVFGFGGAMGAATSMGLGLALALALALALPWQWHWPWHWPSLGLAMALAKALDLA